MTDIDRDDPCPCGSGADYALCCLRTKARGAANDNLADEDTGGWQQQLARAVNRGYQAQQRGDLSEAVDIWLEGWEDVRAELPAAIATLSGLERACDGERSLVSWVWRCLGALRQLAGDDRQIADRGAQFVGDMLVQCPGESEANQRNMRADRAWLLAAADRWEEADAEFDRLVEDFPDCAAGYVTRADALLDHGDDAADRAVEVLEQARSRPVDDAGAWDLMARLREARRQLED